MKKKLKLVMGIVILLLVALLLFTARGNSKATVTVNAAAKEFYEVSYREYLESYGYQGHMSDKQVEVPMQNFQSSEGMTAEWDGEGVVTSEQGKITWEFEVEESGFYNIEVRYFPLKGTTSQIKRMLYLDNEICYAGMKQVVFNRSFTDESTTIAVKNKNEVKPKAVEIFEEQTVYIDDAQKRSIEPFKVYFEKGRHSITFESIKEPVKILGITFKSKPEGKLYQAVKEEWDGRYNKYSGSPFICQAERVDDYTKQIIRSSSSITIKNNVTDANLQPYHPYQLIYNTIGGDNWKYSGETITWKINVPQEGLYKLAFKGRQSVSRGITSYRKLEINGDSPFLEAQSLCFDYSSDMKYYIPGNEEGAYYFYFKEGSNTISMEVVLGAFGETYTQISESILILNDLYRKIVQITGTVPDKYIDYEISKKLPELVSVLEQEQKRLTSVLNSLIEITGEKGENTNLVERMIVQLDRLSKDPDKVALSGELQSFQSNVTSMATWLIQIAEMPLELDYLCLYGEEEDLPEPEAGFWKGLYYNTIRFFATFFVDDTQIETESKPSEGALKVWITAGRDQAQVLQGLIDERFLPEYGIPVQLELVPVEVAIPSTLAGVGPDVMLGIDQGKMMDFAMRNALVDLSQLDGFEEERTKYFPSAIEGITYQGGVYGLPETQMFSMLFYRKDIFDALGLTPPKTWQEFREIIPILQRNNYDACIPGTGPLSSMIVQKGGDLYLGEGNDYGIASGLIEESAMEAFKELTDFFTAYKLPVVVDFANRFRTGEIPIGLADYTEYNKFELLAPEIKGLWEFTEIPGTVQEDGSIDNTVVGTTTQCVMLKTAVGRGLSEDAWTFMRWWMDTETQTEYATAIEAILGTSARYATANKDVLVQLPWSTSEANRLLAQFEHTKGIPPVPGHYMTTRMIDYTYKNVVSDALNPRETLYLNIKEINAELTKKRKEFGIAGEE